MKDEIKKLLFIIERMNNKLKRMEPSDLYVADTKLMHEEAREIVFGIDYDKL